MKIIAAVTHEAGAKFAIENVELQEPKPGEILVKAVSYTHLAYPLDVYGTAILKFCTYIVPYALFQYYPLTYLLGRTGSPLCALAPLAAPLFALPCWIVWRVGVRKYQSAGS